MEAEVLCQGPPGWVLRTPTSVTYPDVSSAIKVKKELGNRDKKLKKQQKAERKRLRDAPEHCKDPSARLQELSSPELSSSCPICHKVFLRGLKGKMFLSHKIGCKAPEAPATLTAPRAIPAVDGSSKWKSKTDDIETFENGKWWVSTQKYYVLDNNAKVVAAAGRQLVRGVALPKSNLVTLRLLSPTVLAICETQYQLGVVSLKNKRTAPEIFAALKLVVPRIDLPDESQIKNWLTSRIAGAKKGNTPSAPRSPFQVEKTRLGKMKVGDLRALCVTMALSDKGTKATLVKALLRQAFPDEGDAESSEDDASSDEEDADYGDPADEIYEVGQTVEREFNDGNVYVGTIEESRGGFYLIAYEDGDRDNVRWDKFDEFEGFGFIIVEPLLKKTKKKKT